MNTNSMNRLGWLKRALTLAILLAVPEVGVACTCPGLDDAIPEDVPVVVGTVLTVDRVDTQWKVAVWPEAVRDPSRCGEYVEFASDDTSCLGRLPEIGARWAAVSSNPSDSLGFNPCSPHGPVDQERTQDWLKPVEKSLHRCGRVSDGIMTAAAEKAARAFAASDRTCEDSTRLPLSKLNRAFVYQESAWGEDDHGAGFEYRPVDNGDDAISSAYVTVFSESRRKCWTRACLVPTAPAGDQESVCTHLRPGSHATSCGTLRFGTSDTFDVSSGRWSLEFTEIPTAPYFGGPAYPDETLGPEQCPLPAPRKTGT